jgi:hypothetical protein
VTIAAERRHSEPKLGLAFEDLKRQPTRFIDQKFTHLGSNHSSDYFQHVDIGARGGVHNGDPVGNNIPWHDHNPSHILNSLDTLCRTASTTATHGVFKDGTEKNQHCLDLTGLWRTTAATALTLLLRHACYSELFEERG